MRRVLSLLLVLVSALPAGAQGGADGVVVRTSLKPENGVVIGQHARVLVDVLFPDAMPRPPRVVLPETSGAQTLRYESQATTMGDTIGGKSYAGQRFEFALYPRRGGQLQVPAARVTVLDKAGNETGHAQGKPFVVDVSVPPGVDASRPVIASSRVTLEEQWSPGPTVALEVGDALTRTVTRSAADVPGMAMLDLAFAAPAGVRVYVDPPRIEDSQDRGDVTGHRVDKATYVFERAGSFTLPGVTQAWWDLDQGKPRVARAPEVTVSVAAAPAARSYKTDLETWIYVATTAAGGIALAWWAWSLLRRGLAGRRARWLSSEAKAYADLRAACRDGDARAVYAAFVVWRSRWPRPVPAVLAVELEQVLFARAAWSAAHSHAFARKVATLRGQHEKPLPLRPLPPLNPLPGAQ